MLLQPKLKLQSAERKVQRSKMFYCNRCYEVNYCSVECQKNDWKTHREFCDEVVEMKATFNTNKDFYTY